MPYLDPYLMNVFRSRICNPACFRRVYGVLRSFRYEHLRDPDGAGAMVDQLSAVMGVPVTAEQRANAVGWLMQCGVDPANPYHQRRMWELIKGF